ncbi:kinase domain protein [Xylona heveae TC161]|uniref:non-specific serine/threonine protein kinase n=1 Tax=Xylona heveae (strain CBS 132557 / TC161) TaxID=1328760 RepID=A0A165HHR2_XYLHT|nr:kinase domain protein [Xylona heveae TC161]KZF23536.1 kinase domain protein [Xylona heveae TC161]
MTGLRLLSRMTKCMSFSLRAKLAQLPAASASRIPQNELVDEELCPGYNPKWFYPAKAGEILSNCYQLLVKIGWGTRSTVWLARDMTRYRWQSERLVTLKIINTHSSTDAHHERDIEKYIARQNPSHRGYGIIRTCLGSFEVAGPEGNHLCLAYEPMREPIWILQKRFVDQKLPLSVAKAYIFILLAGLDYLHMECRVVHTDLKLENILMTFENDSTLSNFVKEQIANLPMQFKTDPTTGQTVYRCHNDFGPLNWRELKKMIPKISDLGLATRLHCDSLEGQEGKREIGLHPIQPDHYRAPEVILGCGWDFSADIWNFGALSWDIIEHTALFRNVHDTQGRYDAKTHLAEMIALLGPPPKEFLAKSGAMAQYKWPDALEDDAGELCSNAREFFGGPFFDEEGQFLYTDLVPARRLEDTIPSLAEKERVAFLSFISHMLTWLPEDRKTARELMEHPFLSLGNPKV